MEIVNEIKLAVTIIDRDVPEETLPYGAKDNADLEKILKKYLDADDLHLTQIQQFVRDEEDK